jgi:hypothetical protein
VRLVYAQGTYRKKEDDQHITRPLSEPAAKCVLTPISQE